MTNRKYLDKRVNSVHEYLKCIISIYEDSYIYDFLANTPGARICYRGDRKSIDVEPHLFSEGLLKTENIDFSKWKNGECGPGGKRCLEISNGNCRCKNPYGIECLAKMQHHDGKTRLLDFTDDPLVALRFAVGKDGFPPEDKKVTYFCSEFIDISKDKKLHDTYIELVNFEYEKVLNASSYNRDYFVKDTIDDELVRRQKGVFLFMGNFSRVNNQDEVLTSSKKEKHIISSENGRGNEYSGFVGTITIDKKAVNEIRDYLESTHDYKMDYLTNRVD